MYDHLKIAKSSLKNDARRPLKEYENAYKRLLLAKKNETLGPNGIMLNKSNGKPEGELHIKIIRCENLLAMDFNGSSDPYVTVTLLPDDQGKEVYDGPGMKEWQAAISSSGGNISNDEKLVKEHPSTQKTKVLHDDLNPIFNEMLIIKPLKSKGGKIRIAVYDEDDVMNDELIGKKTIDLNKVLKQYSNNQEKNISTGNINVSGNMSLSYDLEVGEGDEEEDGEYRGKVFLELNVVYSRIQYYSNIVDSLQRNKDLIVKKVLDAEDELWTLISPFAVGSKDLVLANDDDEEEEEENDHDMNQHDGLVDIDLTIDTDPLPNLNDLPTLNSKMLKVPVPAKFFLCGFTAVAVLIVLLGIILNNGGVNHYAEIYPGEP